MKMQKGMSLKAVEFHLVGSSSVGPSVVHVVAIELPIAKALENRQESLMRIVDQHRYGPFMAILYGVLGYGETLGCNHLQKR